MLQIIGGALLVNITFSGDICYLLLSSVNSLDPDEGGQNVGPDLDTICLKFNGIPERFFIRIIIKKFERPLKIHVIF